MLNDAAKFDPLGNHIWSRIFGNAGSERANGVAVDPDDNVIITGSFRGSLVIDGDTLTNANHSDVFLIKFDGSGNYLWGQSFGSPDDDQVGVKA